MGSSGFSPNASRYFDMKVVMSVFMFLRFKLFNLQKYEYTPTISNVLFDIVFYYFRCADISTGDGFYDEVSHVACAKFREQAFTVGLYRVL